MVCKITIKRVNNRIIGANDVNVFSCQNTRSGLVVVWAALQLKVNGAYFKLDQVFSGKFMRHFISKTYIFRCLQNVQRLNPILVCQTQTNNLQTLSKIHIGQNEGASSS